MTRAISWKRIGISLLIAFFVLFVVQSPAESAGVTRAIFTWIGSTASKVGSAFSSFFGALFYG